MTVIKAIIGETHCNIELKNNKAESTFWLEKTMVTNIGDPMLIIVLLIAF